MLRSFIYLAGLTGALALGLACSATAKSNVFDDRGGDSDTDEPQDTETASANNTDPGGPFDIPPDWNGSDSLCSTSPDEDSDKDGFTVAMGDCNDCDPNVNPGAIEVLNNKAAEDGGMAEPADEDCDGKVDNLPPLCDDNIKLDDIDPMNGAKVMDLCQIATKADKKWGVLSAAYVRADGTPALPSSQVGVLDSFGPHVAPQKGARMLGLSSGRSRTANQPDACGSLSCFGAGPGTAPAGFPQDSPACLGGTNINDDIALELNLRAPTNATGYSFNFDFYSFEYPEWVCTAFNDQFIALVTPPPTGAINGNISFDSQMNPVSVNIAFFQVCGGCALGSDELLGTGFDLWDDAGATSWLKTTAPITGGEEFSIRLTIWDTGDQAWDSTALMDNFEWLATGGTVVIGTEPAD